MVDSAGKDLTEFAKMRSGLLYNPADEELLQKRRRALDLTEKLNSYISSDSQKAAEIARELFGFIGENTAIMARFACDYGENISIGSNCYINYNCVVLDCANVTIGDNVLIAPNCGIYTAIHPLESEVRLLGLETAKPVTIKNGVWLGGNVTILPGVTIGEKSVIGAGSVVTKDIPDHVLAYGNPCKVIKPLS